MIDLRTLWNWRAMGILPAISVFHWSENSDAKKILTNIALQSMGWRNNWVNIIPIIGFKFWFYLPGKKRKTVLISRSQSTERPKGGLYCDNVLLSRNRNVKNALKIKWNVIVFRIMLMHHAIETYSRDQLQRFYSSHLGRYLCWFV